MKHMKKLAAVAVSMAIGTTCLAGLNSLSVFADEADELAKIGMGEKKAQTVQISNETSAELSLEGIDVGQYYVTAYIESVTPTPEEPEYMYYDIMVNVDDEETVYLSYNELYDTYIGVVTVAEDSKTIAFSTYNWFTNYTLTLDVYLQDLFMGASTYNSISGIQVSKDMSRTIALENVEAKQYYVSVSLAYDSKLSSGSNLYVAIDNAKAVELTFNANMYGAYTGYVTIPEGAKALTLSTNNVATITASINLYDVVEDVTESIEMEKPVELELFTPVTFKYIATEETGYYTMSYSAANNAIIEVELRTGLNEFGGETIEMGKYPVYLVKGNTYYFTITYYGILHTETGDEADPATVDATFHLAAWTKSTVSVKEAAFVPVTLENETPVKVNISGIEGTTYYISVNKPYYVDSVTIHYGNETYKIDNEVYEAEIVFEAGVTELWITSDYKFVANVFMSYSVPDYDDTFELGVAKQITLRPDESLLYYLFNLTNGTYAISYTSGDYTNIEVTGAFDDVIVRKGQSRAFFQIELTEWEDTRTGYFYFTNDGTTNATFTVIITKIA